MRNIKISQELSFPADVVTETIAILAKRRAGKSYTMRRFVEQLFKAGNQIVLVDPKGDQWGIRSSTDGKSPGLPIIILGGEHGDAPLEVNSGEIVAKLVVEEIMSILLDVSHFRKYEVAKFMTDFLENLYRLKAQERYRTPMMLVIDEADAIAPQKPQKGEERMLGAAEDIVRRGGQRGIGCTLVTQRSAVLNKNVLTQAQILVALRTIAPQDLAAMKAWIDVHGEPDQQKILMESLPSLPVGDAWFWSPGWPTSEGIFERIHILPIETFDSAATPKPGEKKVVPKNLADIDLTALKKQMAGTIEKMKKEDPKELKKRIAELEREASKRTPEQIEKIIEKRVEIPMLKDSQITRLEKIGEKMTAEAERHGNAMALLWGNFDEIGTSLASAMEAIAFYQKQPVIPQKSPLVIQPRPVFVPNADKTPVADSSNLGNIGLGERRILTAIAQHADGITREHITVLTGYKRSSRDTYLQRLQQRAFIRAALGKLHVTGEGIAELGNDYEQLPTGEELRNHLMRILPEGEKRLLSLLIDSYPEPLDRDILSETTNYKRSSRDTYLQRLSARQLIETEGRGVVKAADKLFV